MSDPMPPTGPRFLKNPTVNFETHEGKILSAFIRLQHSTRKAAKTTQPRPEYPVYLYVDADGYPVGVQMYAPVPGDVVVNIVDELFVDADGRPAGMKTRVECDWVPTKDERKLIRKVLRTASDQFDAAGA